MIQHGKQRYATKDDLFLGFSDTQIEELMRNMTIFMSMDYCPSPCDICAFSAKKGNAGTIMDFDLIDELYSTFSHNFNSNKPNEHASDKLGYRGRNGETYANVLELEREYLDHYQGLLTGFPPGAAEVIWQILNMDFVSENHPSEDETAQLVFPNISRHITNQTIVDKFLRSVEQDERFHRKFRKEKFGPMPDRQIYEVSTTHGIRELRVWEITPLPVGDGKKYIHLLEGKGKFIYGVCINPGVAVLPTGFYNYDGMHYSYQGILQRKITPENFRIQKRRHTQLSLVCDIEANTIKELCVGENVMGR